MSHAMTRIIRRKLVWSPLGECRAIHDRELDLGEPLPPRRGNPVTTIHGVRRCGKSYRLFQEMKRLLALGVPRRRICYFDFEDSRLGTVTREMGSRIVGEFFEMNPEMREEGVYFFLDGIDAVEDWRPWIRSVADSLKAKIYVAGTHAGPLPVGGGSRDEGGFRDRELLPYSFAEYLWFTADAPLWTHYGRSRDGKRLALRQAALTSYFTGGGFPGAIGLTEEKRTKYLQECASRVVHEDVIEAGNLPEPQVVTRFARRVLSTNSQSLSFRRAAGSFRAIGQVVEKGFLRTVVDSMVESGLVFRIPCFDLAEGEAPRDMWKLYAVDPGLARACARVHGNTVSFLLENAVYLELRRRLATNGLQLRCIKNRKNNHEVDFVVGDPQSGDHSELYQVAWSMNKPSVRKREVRSILEAFDEIANLRGDGGAILPKATIIICDCTQKSLAKNRYYLKSLGDRARSISLVPAANWLLGDSEMCSVAR